MPYVTITGQESSHLVVRAEYYGELGCAHCDTFASKQLPAAESASGVRVELELYDVLSTEGFKRCEDRLVELGDSFRVFPVLILGENAFQGNTAIGANLVGELEYYAKHGLFLKRQPPELPPEQQLGVGTSMKWAFVPIFLAGLVDGINPCAFTTLLFFMSYLGLRGGRRRRMAIAGLTFAAGVFMAYFLLGLGLVNALRMGNSLSGLRLVLKLVVSGLTIWFCILSILDVYRLRHGRTTEMILKLPETVRLRIDSSIRTGMKSHAFYPGIFVTGVVVSILELACTGQVYFPAISFMVQTDSSWLGIGSLILYNFAFITPLLAILVLVLSGLRQEALRKFFTQHLVFAKLALAIVFALLALSVWLF
ncbi:MAG: cytochrome c biogenesis protein CcdA [Spirochaetota bacterium]